MEKVTSRWDQIRARRLADPSMQSRYDQHRRAYAEIRHLVESLERERAQLGISKASLARSIGSNPASVRRVLTSDKGNPTLETLVNLCDALGLELVVQRRGDHVLRTPMEETSACNSQERTRAALAG